MITSDIFTSDIFTSDIFTSDIFTCDIITSDIFTWYPFGSATKKKWELVYATIMLATPI